MYSNHIHETAVGLQCLQLGMVRRFSMNIERYNSKFLTQTRSLYFGTDHETTNNAYGQGKISNVRIYFLMYRTLWMLGQRSQKFSLC
jgi:hypothetical protein